MGSLTFKQGQTLYKGTGRKFWELNGHCPSVDQAAAIIGPMFRALFEKIAEDRVKTVSLVQGYFPDFKDSELHWRQYGKKKTAGAKPESGGNGNGKPAAKPTEVPDSTPNAPESQEITPETPPTPEAPKPAAVVPEGVQAAGTLAADIANIARAGIANMLLVGPAGCGKTTQGLAAAEILGIPATLISCSLGTPAYTFTGRRHPISGEYEDTEFTRGYAAGHLLILDEVDKLDPAVAAAVNASLANGHIPTPKGPIARHPATRILATANTWGAGGDRQYCGSNQLDSATLDRFSGGRLAVDYSAEYEAQYDPQVVRYCQKAREHVRERKLRRVVSTRMIIACHALKAAGLEWRGQVTADWTDSERAGLEN